MAVLAGYLAFIVASLFVGCRLVWLWRRTREWAELTIGASFILGGVLGYLAWLAIEVITAGGAPPATIKQVALLGLTVTSLGALNTGIGIALIFRAGQLWAKVGLACVGLAMLVCVSLYARSATDMGSMLFWYPIALSGLFYLWGAIEAISLGLVLRKRALLGMADPLVVNRTLMWGVSNVMIVACITVGYSARVISGVVPPTWTTMLSSSLLLIAAGAIWLGFFPPTAYRVRVERAMESN